MAPTSRSERQQRLRELTAYYEEHIEDFRTPKSLDVLIGCRMPAIGRRTPDAGSPKYYKDTPARSALA